MRRLSLFVLLAGCTDAPCIQPPPTSSQVQRDIILSLAAKFTAIPASPTASTDFKNVVNTAYASLNDVNTSYFIALQAALCFSREGKWGRDVAARMLKDLEDDWKSKSGQKSIDAHPQAAQIKEMQAGATPPK